ncbi:hypothetical protein [Iodobacter fluviatilis]|uniref:Uncharacterized protein n=1 Tax=Iodobacter fluviatilis TaxID=537 RepID=A0A377SUV2_9NEIS|nr:hypothetical protein [Iodobacter fluviatilis]TCU81309.1 hypothetical protein EV682_12321 [Iodobacter fluviatilis]STR45165.1 Uncharacterised protein [Iodobacter fluviatilis]
MAAPKISAQQQRKIEVILTKWNGKLTWDALVERIKLELDLETTRQTLCTYAGINVCFKKKKAQFRGVTLPLYTSVTASDIKLVDQLEHLKAEISILEKNNAEQLRLIERIFANAKAIPNLDLRALIKTRPEDMSK